MAKTYDPSHGTDRDFVRFLIGDTGTNMALTDEEIESIVERQTATGTARPYFAAAEAVVYLFAQMKSTRRGVVDKQISKLRLRYSEDVSAEGAVAKRAAELRTMGVKVQTRNQGTSYSFKIV